jgi:phage repressor protein C with HTH and peptisase S24 domain
MIHEPAYAGFTPHLSTGYVPLFLPGKLRDTPQMVEIPENGLYERIDAQRETLGISARELSLRVTGKPDLIRDLRRRGHAPSADNLSRIAEVLDVSVDWLLGRSGNRSPVRSEVTISDRRLDWGGPKPDLPPIPLVGTGDCATIQFEDDGGKMLDVERCSFNADHTVRMIARPPALKGARDLYAIYFQGESMMPRFEPGEVGIVDPTRPAGPGDYVLVQLTNGEEDHVTSVLVKRLVRSGPRELVLEQFNPPATFTVPRTRVARVHRILPQTDLLFG